MASRQRKRSSVCGWLWGGRCDVARQQGDAAGDGLRELALFAGAGGGILGGKLLGWRTVCAVEIEPYCQEVLKARQRDGSLEPFPIWDDVRTFDGAPWRGYVDVITGGFPCQDISSAGRGAGIEGERSGLWRDMARIVGEVRPRFVLVENSPLLVSRGLAVVLGDLAAMGYDARWGCFRASDVGAPHERDRLFVAAYPKEGLGAAWCGREHGRRKAFGWRDGDGAGDYAGVRVEVAAAHGREPDDVAYRMDRLEALGNGQVPSVVALAWRTLIG